MNYMGDTSHKGWWKSLLAQNGKRIRAEEHGFGGGVGKVGRPCSPFWAQNLGLAFGTTLHHVLSQVPFS